MEDPSTGRNAADRIEHRRAVQRAWRQANPDKVNAQQQRNRPAIERYNAANRDKILEQKRVAERKRLERIKAEEEARERVRERSRQWKRNHQEERREYERQYRNDHREQLRERGRNYYAQHKDEIAARRAARSRTDPEYRDADRRYRESNPDKVREQQRAYRSKPDVYQQTLEYNKQWRRRERARLKAGLPRARNHRTLKAEQEAQTATADAFFARVRTSAEQRAISQELHQLREEKVRQEKIARRRQVERTVIARQNAEIINTYLQRHGQRLREEVRLDSRAREIRGAGPYPDLEAETRRRAADLIEEARSVRRQKAQARAQRSGQGMSRRHDPNTGPITGARAATPPTGRSL
jgi:hypothetical protein